MKKKKEKVKKKTVKPEETAAPSLQKDMRTIELEGLTPEDVIKKAESRGFQTGRTRDLEVALATLKVLVSIRDALFYNLKE